MTEFTFTKTEFNPLEAENLSDFGTGYKVHFHPTKATFRSDGTYIGRVKKANGGWEGFLPGKNSAATWRTGSYHYAAESLAHKVI